MMSSPSTLLPTLLLLASFCFSQASSHPGTADFTLAQGSTSVYDQYGNPAHPGNGSNWRKCADDGGDSVEFQFSVLSSALIGLSAYQFTTVTAAWGNSLLQPAPGIWLGLPPGAGNTLITGPFLITATGAVAPTCNHPIPAGMAGVDIIVQYLVITPLAGNGSYLTTDGLEIEVY